MSTHWPTLLGQLTALATVVALSPFSVIPAIAVVMHSERARVTGVAFVAGWLAGKAAITVAFIGLPRLLHGWLDRPAPAWTPWLQIAAGAVFVLGGLWYWRRARGASVGVAPTAGISGGSAPPGAPRWLTRLKHITPGTAAAVGVALTLINPKVLAACAAAGVAIGGAGLGTAAGIVAVAYFTLLAGSTAAVPILAYTVWSHRVDRALERFTSWLARRQVVLTVGLLVVIGLALLSAGLREVL
jgi:Sap, sulfolipid-1-addressing protein